MAKNSMRIGIELKNWREYANMLRELPGAVQKNVASAALKKAAAPIVSIAKGLAPQRTGALKKSITSIIKAYPKQGKVVAIIGPDNDYYAGKKRVKKGGDRRGTERPASYAHLVEFGHAVAKGGSLRPQYNLKLVTGKNYKGKLVRRWKRGTIKTAAKGHAAGNVPAKPFLRPAVLQGTAPAQAALEEGFATGIEREIKRLQNKLKKT
jgi:HK97 gp10 family phage protein